MGAIQTPPASEIRPVRRLAPTWALALGFFGVFVAVAFAGASVFGMYGVRALTMGQRIAVFSVLACMAGFAAVAAAREMRPAGGRRIAGWALAVTCCSMLLGFALLFHDYGMRRFAAQGMPCFGAGLLFAVPAAFCVTLLFRRGFVLNLIAAGLAAGLMAGLAGLGMLELHCPNLNAMHVMFWHVAVVVVSGLAGMLAGWIITWRRART